MHKQLPKSRACRRSPVRKGKHAVKVVVVGGACGSLRAPQTMWLCVATEHAQDADRQLEGPEGEDGYRPAAVETCDMFADTIGH